MPSRSHARRHGFRSLTLAGAVALGLGSLLPLRSQESDRVAKGGSRVKDPVIERPDRERDLLTLKARLFEQRKVTLRAESDFNKAKLTRELTEFAVQEYTEVIFPQEWAAIEDELTGAQADLLQAKKDVDWARSIVKKGYLLFFNRHYGEVELKRAEFHIEQARSKKLERPVAGPRRGVTFIRARS